MHNYATQACTLNNTTQWQQRSCRTEHVAPKEGLPAQAKETPDEKSTACAAKRRASWATPITKIKSLGRHDVIGIRREPLEYRTCICAFDKAPPWTSLMSLRYASTFVVLGWQLLVLSLLELFGIVLGYSGRIGRKGSVRRQVAGVHCAWSKAIDLLRKASLVEGMDPEAQLRRMIRTWI